MTILALILGLFFLPTLVYVGGLIGFICGGWMGASIGAAIAAVVCINL